MEARAECPSVFVVDVPQRDVPFVPPVRRSLKAWSCGQLILGILMLLTMAGLGIQGYFLILFRKELDKATTQENVEATHEKLIHGHRPETEKPAAHLIGTVCFCCSCKYIWKSDTSRSDMEHGASFTEAGSSTLQWEHSGSVSGGGPFLQDMSYKEGSLICNKSGHYYIYSKLCLGNPNCSDVQPKSMLVTHIIYKRTPGYPRERPLLTNSIPYCNWKGNTLWWHNSFLAGVVQLKEKEEIYVKVSETQLVRVRDGTRSYFGTFMI